MHHHNERKTHTHTHIFTQRTLSLFRCLCCLAEWISIIHYVSYVIHAYAMHFLPRLVCIALSSTFPHSLRFVLLCHFLSWSSSDGSTMRIMKHEWIDECNDYHRFSVIQFRWMSFSSAQTIHSGASRQEVTERKKYWMKEIGIGDMLLQCSGGFSIQDWSTRR